MKAEAESKCLKARRDQVQSENCDLARQLTIVREERNTYVESLIQAFANALSKQDVQASQDRSTERACCGQSKSRKSSCERSGFERFDDIPSADN